MFYHFKIHKDNDGLWAECLELVGCQTQADSIDELQENMKEVLNLFLSEPTDSKMIFPMPIQKKMKTKNIIEVEVDPSVAFSLLMRMTRLKKRLTLREMTEKLNYKNINTYAKLENAKTANPELRTLAKIKKVFSDFPIGLLLA